MMLIKSAISLACLVLSNQVGQAAAVPGLEDTAVSGSPDRACVPLGSAGAFPTENIHLKFSDCGGPEGQTGHFHGASEGVWFNADTAATVDEPDSIDILVWNPFKVRKTFWLGSHVWNGTADTVTRMVLEPTPDEKFGRTNNHFCYSIKPGSFVFGSKHVWAVAVS